MDAGACPSAFDPADLDSATIVKVPRRAM
jgi:hypothetical protein